MSTDLGELYAAARHRITDLVMSTPAESFNLICPATPEWSVHDLLAHLRGLTEDVRTGNLAGVATDPWTAAQVDRHRDADIATLLAGWADDAAVLESVLSSPNGQAASRAVIDIHTHEADLRGAIGRPAPLPAGFGEWITPMLAAGLIDKIEAAGKPHVRIVTDDGDEFGEVDAPVVLRISRFELFRAVLGRRTPAQVAAYDWTGADGGQYSENFFVFGPRDTDLVE